MRCILLYLVFMFYWQAYYPQQYEKHLRTSHASDLHKCQCCSFVCLVESDLIKHYTVSKRHSLVYQTSAIGISAPTSASITSSLISATITSASTGALISATNSSAHTSACITSASTSATKTSSLISASVTIASESAHRKCTIVITVFITKFCPSLNCCKG